MLIKKQIILIQFLTRMMRLKIPLYRIQYSKKKEARDQQIDFTFKSIKLSVSW